MLAPNVHLKQTFDFSHRPIQKLNHLRTTHTSTIQRELTCTSENWNGANKAKLNSPHKFDSARQHFLDSYCKCTRDPHFSPDCATHGTYTLSSTLRDAAMKIPSVHHAHVLKMYRARPSTRWASAGPDPVYAITLYSIWDIWQVAMWLNWRPPYYEDAFLSNQKQFSTELEDWILTLISLFCADNSDCGDISRMVKNTSLCFSKFVYSLSITSFPVCAQTFFLFLFFWFFKLFFFLLKWTVCKTQYERNDMDMR